jgi:hypothetical protein
MKRCAEEGRGEGHRRGIEESRLKRAGVRVRMRAF